MIREKLIELLGGRTKEQEDAFYKNKIENLERENKELKQSIVPVQCVQTIEPPVTLTISHIISPAPQNEEEFIYAKGLLLEELVKGLDDKNLISICTTTTTENEDATITAMIRVLPF